MITCVFCGLEVESPEYREFHPEGWSCVWPEREYLWWVDDDIGLRIAILPVDNGSFGLVITDRFDQNLYDGNFPTKQEAEHKAKLICAEMRP